MKLDVNTNFKNNYPKLADWMATELPKLPSSKPRVWKAFLKYSELSQNKAKKSSQAREQPNRQEQKYARGQWEVLLFSPSGHDLSLRSHLQTVRERVHKQIFAPDY